MPYYSETRDHLILFLLLATLCSACSTSHNITSNTTSAPKKTSYSINYIIHADANYLYHDSDGNSHRADEKVLQEAKKVAQQAKNGEVFIFHQRPEKKILWIFPKKDRVFLHYRNGKLVTKMSYSPASDSGVFTAESQLLQQQKQHANSEIPNILLYFGHEIPYKNGSGYFASIPKLPVNTNTFAAGIKTMLPDSLDSFDLTVLSTCNNGSPDMVSALQPHTSYLLASPQNLHLSHIDTKSLQGIEQQPEMDTKTIAERIAQSTYLRLQKSVQTVVSLSIFDMTEISSYLEGVSASYDTYLEDESTAKPGVDNIDCKKLPVFSADVNFSTGITSWYRPPRFGKKAKEKSHSGWGCKE